MSIDTPSTKEVNSSFQFIEGEDDDFQNLPSQLDMTDNSSATQSVDSDIELGPLTFNYSTAKEEVRTGKSRLRLMKNDHGDLMGFSVFSTGQENHTLIKMLWVNKSARRSGVGIRLINDILMQVPDGQVSMDIWGGEPMINLALKCGFVLDPGENMMNRYVHSRPKARITEQASV